MEQARGGAGSDWAGTTGKDEGVASGGWGPAGMGHLRDGPRAAPPGVQHDGVLLAFLQHLVLQGYTGRIKGKQNNHKKGDAKSPTARAINHGDHGGEARRTLPLRDRKAPGPVCQETAAKILVTLHTTPNTPMASAG